MSVTVIYAVSLREYFIRQNTGLYKDPAQESGGSQTEGSHKSQIQGRKLIGGEKGDKDASASMKPGASLFCFFLTQDPTLADHDPSPPF